MNCQKKKRQGKQEGVSEEKKRETRGLGIVGKGNGTASFVRNAGRDVTMKFLLVLPEKGTG